MLQVFQVLASSVTAWQRLNNFVAVSRLADDDVLRGFIFMVAEPESCQRH